MINKRRNSEAKINTISIYNTSGGVGKSTFVALLAQAIAMDKKKQIALIDCDKNLDTNIIIGAKGNNNNLYKINGESIKVYIRENIGVITPVESINYLKSMETPNRELLFKDLQEGLRFNKYSNIIYDVATINEHEIKTQVLEYSDIVIIPIANSIFTLRGAESVYAILKNGNKKSITKNIFFVYPLGKNKVSEEHDKLLDSKLEVLIKKFNGLKFVKSCKVLNEIIPFNMEIDKIIETQSTIFNQNKTSDIAGAYKNIAKEIIA